MNHPYTSVPNHFLDVSLKMLKEVELKVLLVITRQTIGWQKQSDWIATSQMCERTGACKKAVLAAVKALTAKGLIRIKREDGMSIYTINVPSEWNNVPSQRKNLPRSREDLHPQAWNNIPPTKETITKESNVPDTKIKAVRESLIALGILKTVH